MIEKKRIWSVAIPITGVIYTEVEGVETEEEAIEAALEQSFKSKDISEWEMHRRVVQGNVCHAHTREATAEEM